MNSGTGVYRISLPGSADRSSSTIRSAARSRSDTLDGSNTRGRTCQPHIRHVDPQLRLRRTHTRRLDRRGEACGAICCVDGFLAEDVYDGEARRPVRVESSEYAGRKRGRWWRGDVLTHACVPVVHEGVRLGVLGGDFVYAAARSGVDRPANQDGEGRRWMRAVSDGCGRDERARAYLPAVGRVCEDVELRRGREAGLEGAVDGDGVV